jgi:hypothetical protein
VPDAKVKEAFLYRSTIQYQLGSDHGYLMKRSFGKFLRGFFAAVGTFFRIIFKFSRTKRSFKQMRFTTVKLLQSVTMKQRKRL